MSVRVVVCLVLLKISLSDCVPFDAMSHEDQLFSSRFRERDFCFCRFSGSSGKLVELGSATGTLGGGCQQQISLSDAGHAGNSMQDAPFFWF